jgi:hypothetical protein
MKLQIVSARTGVTWVKEGIRCFWRQPLALSGLFFVFLGVISLTSLLPLVGAFTGLVLLPALSLGLMAASRETVLGKFPMPSILFIGFREGALQSKRMVLTGFCYAMLFCLILALSSLVDGGEFARMYLLGGEITETIANDSRFQEAVLFSLVLYLPLSALFWHAPALIHWHMQPVVKSLFFSVVACVSNWRAFALFGLTWALIFVTTSLFLSVISMLTDDGQLSLMLLLPAMLMLSAMFFTSCYFSFRDCFISEPVLA